MPTITKPSDHFQVVTWTGNNTKGHLITTGFQPDLVWIKSRSDGQGHKIYDSVRGPLLQINPNFSLPESPAPGHLTAFGANGFTLGDDSGVNQSGKQYVAWCWKAGGAAVANNDGSQPSQVSVNQAAGFSIVKYTGTGNGSPATIGHGLNAVPKFIIVKNLRTSEHWVTYHAETGKDSYGFLETSDEIRNNIANYWGPSGPDNRLIHVAGGVGAANRADEHIAYCWAEVPGFSKFGSYIGNGDNNGTFVYTGFRPAYVLVKKVSASNWILLDSARSEYNPCDDILYPNTGDSEGVNDGNHAKDFLSNGFKMRSGHGDDNGGGSKYVYMAFAEHPFKYANAR